MKKCGHKVTAALQIRDHQKCKYIKYDFFKMKVASVLRSLYINDYQDKIKRTRNYSHITSP